MLLLPVVLLPACKKNDVFAPWRDSSKYVIPTDVNSFVVMQYNIWGANSPWSAERFDNVAAVINSQRPDFVTLNEVDSMTTRNKWFMCKELAKRTGMKYTFSVAREPDEWNGGGGSYGDAVLSKYPVLEARRFKLYPDSAQGDFEKENRSVCAILTEVNGFRFWVATTHLDHRGAELSRISQAHQLKPIVESLEGPVVLCGDLNATPDSKTIEIISEYLTPQYPSDAKEYYTYPSNYKGQVAPSALIDYIMLKNGDSSLNCLSYYVVNRPASDHCAVVATFKFNK